VGGGGGPGMCQQEMRACESVAMSECESVGYVHVRVWGTRE
jgi:hypothetical protein